ncbi:MAG TPA: type II secretion system protein [Methylomirabilota bacterium]|nr:type II secretion system protein [Methylomirabilota bacterium]
MKLQTLTPSGLSGSAGAAGFSLLEVTVGMGVIGMTAAALFSGFTSGFFNMQMARENLRATQIMLEKTETIRLYNWSQITSNGFIPATFTEAYDPHASGTNHGIVYTGTVSIANVPFTNSYSANMRLITVRVSWRTGELDRSREFSTFVSRDGLQDYIF